MKYFSIPSDYKLNTLDLLTELNQKHIDSKVAEVYGQVTDSKIMSSGRPIKDIPSAKMDELSEYVNKCEQGGISFNYTLNSSCMSNNEFYEENQRELIWFVEELIQMGVRHFTVALPSIMEIIRNRYPDIKIKASAICEIDSVSKALFYKKLGVDKIVIEPDIIRDFGKLEHIAEEYRGKMEIIVNNVCMKNCPYKKFHYIHDSHDTGLQDIRDFYTNRCALQKADKFYNPIKLNWVRPEDLKYYYETGIQYFKIQGRQNLNKGYLLRTLEFYMNERFDGNLFDLITLFNPYNSFQVNIDNGSLEGFIKPFVDKALLCSGVCESCQYCYQYAKKSINREAADEINGKCKAFYGEYDHFTKMSRAMESRSNSTFYADSFNI